MGEEKGREGSEAKRVVDTGGGAYFEGDVEVTGGDVVGRDQYKSGLSAAELQQLFEPIYEQIATRPDTSPDDKADLTADVRDIEEEVAKGDGADEAFLAQRLRNIGRMAPDILDVVVAALANPAAGFATVVKKVAERAKAKPD